MKSKFLSISSQDVVRGFIMAFATAFVTALIDVLKDGSMPTLAELQKAGIYGLTTGLIYLTKNFLTNSNDELLKNES